MECNLIGLIDILNQNDDVRYSIDSMTSLYRDNLICKIILGIICRMFPVSLMNVSLFKGVTMKHVNLSA